MIAIEKIGKWQPTVLKFWSCTMENALEITHVFAKTLDRRHVCILVVLC